MNRVHFNGRPYTLPAQMSVRQVLERLGMHGKRVAVERNGMVVPKARHDEVVVGDGDRLEVIVAVGGG